ncbi:MAG: hypothetical protein M3R27_06600 [Bacteroidota bacterium]|nr:hypothetical protein [Bacteroidota bacterium]
MKKIAILTLSVLITVNAFAQKRVKSPVDGKIFSLTLTEEGKKKPEITKDECSFLSGKFKSNYMFQAGFTQVDYEYEVDSTSGKPVVKFTAEAKNDESQERFSWEGSVDDDKLTGTAIIRKKGKVLHTYAVTGTQKNKKKPKPQPKPAPVPTDSTRTTTDSVQTAE